MPLNVASLATVVCHTPKRAACGKAESGAAVNCSVIWAILAGGGAIGFPHKCPFGAFHEPVLQNHHGHHK